MEEWLQANMSVWVFWPISVIGLFSGLLLIPSARVRRFLLTLGVLVVAGEVYVCVRLVHRQIAKAADSRKSPKPSPTAVTRPTPKPSPSPLREKPTPQASSPVDTVESDPMRVASFFMTSVNDPSIQDDYCLDATVRGRLYANSGSLKIDVESADLDLCTKSDRSQRQVIYQVGIGNQRDIANRNMGAVSWSEPVTGKIAAGVTTHLAPRQLFIKKNLLKNGQLNLANYAPVVRVFNPEKRGEYFLPGDFH